MNQNLRNLIADLWAQRVPLDEAGRILGQDVSTWDYQDVLMALYCWKMDLLEVTEDKHLPELLRLEQTYLDYRSKH